MKTKSALMLILLMATLDAHAASNKNFTCKMNYTTNDETTRHLVQLSKQELTISSIDGDSEGQPDGSTSVQALSGDQAAAVLDNLKSALNDKSGWISTLINPAPCLSDGIFFPRGSRRTVAVVCKMLRTRSKESGFFRSDAHCTITTTAPAKWAAA